METGGKAVGHVCSENAWVGSEVYGSLDLRGIELLLSLVRCTVVEVAQGLVLGSKESLEEVG